MAATLLLKKLPCQLSRSTDNVVNGVRCFSTGSVLNRGNLRSGVYRVTIAKNRRLTYEQAQGPYKIGVTKTWNSWNTSNLKDEDRKSSEITVEDLFIRKFMYGTWPKVLASEVIIKRRLNMIIISGIIHSKILPTKIYFLTGYTEELLTHLLKRPVKVELQTLKFYNHLVYKSI